jgi:hypothetical protein
MKKSEKNERKMVESVELTIEQMQEMNKGMQFVSSYDLPTSISFDLAIIRQKVKPYLEAWKEENTRIFEKYAEKFKEKKDPDDKKSKIIEKHEVPEGKLVEYNKEEKILLQRKETLELPLIYLTDLDAWKKEEDISDEEKEKRQIPSGFIMYMYPVIRK